MGKYSIPSRWLDYTALGKCIEGTKIVAFKVPLKQQFCTQNNLKQEEWFTPEMLLKQQPNLKTVIDLTFTDRYYNAREEFGAKGIAHIKIMVEGKGRIPSKWQVQRFFDAVDAHMTKYTETDALVGVHCTHGLNRTGYFVCKYLVDRLEFEPDDAISSFNAARGHNMERETFLNDIKRTKRLKYEAEAADNYRSPLGDDLYGEARNDSYYKRKRGGGRNDQRKSGGPSRSDLDTNWRARGSYETKDGLKSYSQKKEKRKNKDRHRNKNKKAPSTDSLYISQLKKNEDPQNIIKSPKQTEGP